MIYFFTALSLCGLIAAYIFMEKNKTLGTSLYALALLILLIPAFIGMDFSPSFTAWFLYACICLHIGGEIFSRAFELLYKGEKTYLKYLFHALFILGNLFVLPATYIYAVGDDWITPNVWITVIVASVLALLLFFFTKKQARLAERIFNSTHTWVALSAGIFTVLCGIFSTFLLPVGLGVLALHIAEQYKDKQFSHGVFWLGIFLINVWLVAPMVF